MSSSDFPIEKTKYGDQYIIPGTEKRIRPKKTKAYFKLENNQYCLPGTEPRFPKGGVYQKRVRKKISRSQKETLSTLDLFTIPSSLVTS
ncbi:MAG: hypothetical protein ACKOW3_08560 [Hyphomicrobium sp.]